MVSSSGCAKTATSVRAAAVDDAAADAGETVTRGPRGPHEAQSMAALQASHGINRCADAVHGGTLRFVDARGGEILPEPDPPFRGRRVRGECTPHDARRARAPQRSAARVSSKGGRRTAHRHAMIRTARHFPLESGPVIRL